jgi:hypothetical protein
MFFFNTILTFFLYFSSLVSAADTSAWKSRSIYFVLTDRIARSSSDTGGSSCGDLGNYCGGTFKGLESKLDYIKGLGFDAIWITPVVASGYSFRKNWTMANKMERQRGRLSWLLGAGLIFHQLELRHSSRLKEFGLDRSYKGMHMQSRTDFASPLTDCRASMS